MAVLGNRFGLRALMVFAVLVFAACGGDGDASNSQLAEGSPAGPLVFTVDDVSGDEALAEGQLVIEECAVLVAEDFGRLLLVWPPNRATWDSELNAIEFIQPDETTIVLVDEMELGVGGSVAVAGLDLATPIDSGCTYDNAWVVTSFLESA